MSKKRALILVGSFLLGIVAIILVVFVATRPMSHYNKGLKLLEQKLYEQAYAEFDKAGSYNDAAEKKEYADKGVHFLQGISLLDSEKISEAIDEFTAAKDFPGVNEQAELLIDHAFNSAEWELTVNAISALPNQADNRIKIYSLGMISKNNGNYAEALSLFEQVIKYSDSAKQVKECAYVLGNNALDDGNYTEALEYLAKAYYYQDASELTAKANYLEAKRLFDTKEYESALSYFKQANGYNDSKDWIIKTNYELGKIELQANNYSKAITYFKNAPDYEDASELVKKSEFEYGKAEYAAGNYKNALSLFSNIEDEEGVEEWIKKTTLAQGKQAFNNKDYQTAISILGGIKGYEDANEWKNRATLMLAEDYFSNKKYDSALALYKKLPNSFSYNSIKVSDRVKSIELYNYFKKFEGSYKCTYGYKEVRQTSKSSGYWYNWYNNDKDGYCDIHVTISNDGKVTISGDASGYAYANWSVISSGLRYTHIHASFSKVVTSKSMPKTLYKDDDVTLKFTGGTTFELKYYRVEKNEDLFFNYKYVCNYKFKK